MQIDEVKTSKKGFKISWSDEKRGFGELTFDGKEIDSEYMGEDFCKEVFSAFVEKYLPKEFKKKK